MSGRIVKEVLTDDLVQRNCALYVALRSRALKKAASFGNDRDEAQPHWNMCPNGNMVACVSTPTASGDTIQTGIPLPY